MSTLKISDTGGHSHSFNFLARFPSALHALEDRNEDRDNSLMPASYEALPSAIETAYLPPIRPVAQSDAIMASPER